MYAYFTYLDVTIKLTTNKKDIINYCYTSFSDYFDFSNKISFDSEVIICDKPIFNSKISYKSKSFHSFELFYDRKLNHIVVTSLNHDYCLEIMRLVRELLIFHIDKNSLIFLHAACVTKNDNGIIILGEKNSGKTTTCIALLKHGYDLVSNDKLLVEQIDNEIVCRGLPISIGIRNNTKVIFKEIENLTFNCEDNRYYIKPQELVKRFNVNISNICKAKLIILPRYTPDKIKIDSKKINFEEKKEIIIKQILDTVYEKQKILDTIDFYRQKEEVSLFNEIPMYEIYVNETLNISLDNEINKILKGENECIKSE